MRNFSFSRCHLETIDAVNCRRAALLPARCTKLFSPKIKLLEHKSGLMNHQYLKINCYQNINLLQEILFIVTHWIDLQYLLSNWSESFTSLLAASFIALRGPCSIAACSTAHSSRCSGDLERFDLYPQSRSPSISKQGLRTEDSTALKFCYLHSS